MLRETNNVGEEELQSIRRVATRQEDKIQRLLAEVEELRENVLATERDKVSEVVDVPDKPSG